MLRTLQDLFDSFKSPATSQSPVARAHSLHLAAAVLLVEVMRADTKHGEDERIAVISALRNRFALADDELDRLVDLALVKAKDAHDYHQFTNVINDSFTHPEKVELVELLWQVAYADAHLDANENHAISKIAGLLHVTHGEYIAAKLHAMEAAGAR